MDFSGVENTLYVEFPSQLLVYITQLLTNLSNYGIIKQENITMSASILMPVTYLLIPVAFFMALYIIKRIFSINLFTYKNIIN